MIKRVEMIDLGYLRRADQIEQRINERICSINESKNEYVSQILNASIDSGDDARFMLIIKERK